jgi:hypothetical protein
MDEQAREPAEKRTGGALCAARRRFLPAVIESRHGHAVGEAEEGVLAPAHDREHLDLAALGEVAGEAQCGPDRAAHAVGVDEQDADLRRLHGLLLRPDRRGLPPDEGPGESKGRTVQPHRERAQQAAPKTNGRFGRSQLRALRPDQGPRHALA